MTESNFTFLSEHDSVFLQLASGAEQVFAADPNTTLIKLRQLGEESRTEKEGRNTIRKAISAKTIKSGSRYDRH